MTEEELGAAEGQVEKVRGSALMVGRHYGGRDPRIACLGLLRAAEDAAADVRRAYPDDWPVLLAIMDKRLRAQHDKGAA